jgi:leader peptidase (prepilin peptidase)/N-methyltransferase
MDLFFYFIAFLLGACFASFIARFVYRQETKEKNHRSFCDNCKKNLSPCLLFPILSFIFTRGKCFYCKNKISINYFLIEIISGITFVFLFNIFSANFNLIYSFLLTCFFGFLFILLVYQDYKSKTVDSIFLYSFLFFSFLFFSYNSFLQKEIVLFPIISLLILFLIDYFLIKKEIYFGMADLYFGFAIYFLFGLQNSINIILYSIWGGAIISILYMFIVHKKYVKHFSVPFLPFFLLGFLIHNFLIYFFNFSIFKLQDILFLWQFLF